MKIKTGKYYHQFGLGVSFIYYAKGMWSIIFDFGLWYVEVSSDVNEKDEWIPYFTEGILRCDRCGSPNDIQSHFNEKLEYELVCDECLRYEDYMNSLTNMKPKANKKKKNEKS